MSELEHLNVTVSDPSATAALLCDLFGWHIRWKGASIHDGHSVHVGSDASYLALYAPPDRTEAGIDSYRTRAGLNHLGVTVTDLDAVEARVIKAGYTPHSHQDYEPGRRFYFKDADGIEFEVVCYD